MSSTTENARWHDGDPLEEAERLIAEGRAGEAAEFLRLRIAEGRGALLARLAYASALDAAGDKTGALAVARETAMLHPGIAAAALGLGKALLTAEQLPTAIAEFQRALRLDPELDEARLLLGCAWQAAGEADKALKAFAALRPETPGLAGKIAQAEAMRARPRSDAGYVRHLFDQFSADYDARMLSQLSYRAPQILRALADLTMPGRDGLAMLDLGCGTGLSGAAFKDLTARLDGIDLSPAMIEKARARGIYDWLAVADIEVAPALAEGRYDLVLAADTLVYLGDLAATMQGVARALKADGFFLFTVEKKEGEGFELGPKRRWRHSEMYMRELAEAHELEIAGLLACTPRMEGGTPVEGLAMALRKPV
ncbi:MAG: methyltransferase domain-containing protein [Rhizomicrobium sp.]